MGTSSKELAQKLGKLAKKQHGCFTAAQAIEKGYADSVHLYHVKNGKWIRVYRGVYRFADVPETPASRCMAALLWTRDKSGKIQGYLTIETASALQSGTLSHSQPIQIGVPKGFRRSSQVPKGIQIHILKEDLHKTSKIEWLPVWGHIPKSMPERLKGMDKPDYYDWLDYQAVLCSNAI